MTAENGSKADRMGKVRDWGEMSHLLPDIDPKYSDFLSTYFRAQKEIAEGRKNHAQDIVDGLEKKTGFVKFEENNQNLFVAIEIAVRGFSSRTDEKKIPIEPLFRNS